MKRSAPLQRKTPMKRKAARHKHVRVCEMTRCGRRAVRESAYCQTHLVAIADALSRDIVFARDQHCQRCPATSQLQWSHHITRGRHGTRWNPENACVHCASCHAFLTNHPALHTEWIIGHIGQAKYDELVDLAYGPRDANGRRPIKVQPPDVLEVIEELRDGWALPIAGASEELRRAS